MRGFVIPIALLLIVSPLIAQPVTWRRGPPHVIPIVPDNRPKPIRIRQITPKAEPVPQDVAIPFVPNCVAYPVGTDFSKVYKDPSLPPRPVENTDPIDFCTGKPRKDKP